MFQQFKFELHLLSDFSFFLKEKYQFDILMSLFKSLKSGGVFLLMILRFST